jgi:hypothetical protein
MPLLLLLEVTCRTLQEAACLSSSSSSSRVRQQQQQHCWSQWIRAWQLPAVLLLLVLLLVPAVQC